MDREIAETPGRIRPDDLPLRLLRPLPADLGQPDRLRLHQSHQRGQRLCAMRSEPVSLVGRHTLDHRGPSLDRPGDVSLPDAAVDDRPADRGREWGPGTSVARRLAAIPASASRGPRHWLVAIGRAELCDQRNDGVLGRRSSTSVSCSWGSERITADRTRPLRRFAFLAHFGGSFSRLPGSP